MVYSINIEPSFATLTETRCFSQWLPEIHSGQKYLMRSVAQLNEDRVTREEISMTAEFDNWKYGY
jgi:hypothetical protein